MAFTLLDRLFGIPQQPGLLSDQTAQQARSGGLIGAGLGLLDASAPHPFQTQAGGLLAAAVRGGQSGAQQGIQQGQQQENQLQFGNATDLPSLHQLFSRLVTQNNPQAAIVGKLIESKVASGDGNVVLPYGSQLRAPGGRLVAENDRLPPSQRETASYTDAQAGTDANGNPIYHRFAVHPEDPTHPVDTGLVVTPPGTSDGRPTTLPPSGPGQVAMSVTYHRDPRAVSPANPQGWVATSIPIAGNQNVRAPTQDEMNVARQSFDAVEPLDTMQQLVRKNPDQFVGFPAGNILAFLFDHPNLGPLALPTLQKSGIISSMPTDDQQAFIQSAEQYVNALVRMDATKRPTAAMYRMDVAPYMPNVGDTKATVLKKVMQQMGQPLGAYIRSAGPAWENQQQAIDPDVWERVRPSLRVGPRGASQGQRLDSTYY